MPTCTKTLSNGAEQLPLPSDYSIRKVLPEDCSIVATQRGQMFFDMGTLSQSENIENHDIWSGWLEGAIFSGDYFGCLATYANYAKGDCGTEIAADEVVGGVGILIQPKMPSRNDPTLYKALILNMYVKPTHRRQGLAEALMQAALADIQARGIRSVSLNAAPMGQYIYKRLGFVEATCPEMRLTLEAGE